MRTDDRSRLTASTGRHLFYFALCIALATEAGRASVYRNESAGVGARDGATSRAAEQPVASIDRLFEEFFDEDSSRDASRVAERIVKQGVTFEEALARLERGRQYGSDVDTGELRWIGPHSPRVGVRTLVLVPRDYNPAFAYPVRIQLHGDVGAPDPPGMGRRRFDPRLATKLESSRATIHVLPAGYAAAQWWFANQVDNLRWIVDRLKRAYNIDENHVHLMGVSDGGTGAFFVAMRDTTPWSSFVSLNGSPRVLTNTQLGVDGELFASNVANKPLYVVNGGRDPQYPAASVTPFVDLFRRAGADVSFRVKGEAGHETTWWDEEQFEVDDFVDESARDPLPARVSWRTERVDRYNRAHWLVITQLASSPGRPDLPLTDDTELEDVNDLKVDSRDDFGLRIDLKVASGRRVVGVVEGTNAARAGLQKGDTLLEVDGVRVRDGRQLAELLERHSIERPVQFTVERERKRLTLSAPASATEEHFRRERAFPRDRPSGRVDLEQVGNRIEARTSGVERFTLLLSPRRFDFAEPIVVKVNGREVLNRRLAPDVATLLKWAAIDNDRTMLFGVEVPIEVPR